jgi:hypothetical protein
LGHGSFDNKVKIIEDFCSKYSECSKKSIERKIGDMFIKEKKGTDPRARWYASENTLAELVLT